VPRAGRSLLLLVVANRPTYVALAVTYAAVATSSVCGPTTAARAADYWLRVLTELKNRGVAGVLRVVCDGLIGPTDAVAAV
jgi:putative transposase